MQISPVNASAGVFGFMDTSSSNAESFAFAMNDALDSVNSGDNFSATSALSEERDSPLVESPYSRHTTDGVTYTLSEVTFSKAELRELRTQLVKEGAPESALKNFDILADQPDGATLAQVMASLLGGNKPAQLSESEEAAITGLLGRIDPSGKLAGDALEFMRQGNGLEAINLIRNALGGMAGDKLDADAEAVYALGRGLGLDKAGLQSLMNNFGGASSLTLNASRFDSLLGPATNQLLENAANSQKLDAALEKTLKPIISKARDRMEKEKAAATLSDKRVAQSRVLIDRSVQKNSREIMDKVVTGEEDAGKGATPDAKDSLKLKTADDAANVNSEKNLKAKFAEEHEAQATAGDLREGAESHNEFSFRDSGKDSGFTNRDGRDSDPWKSLLSRVETRPSETAFAASEINYAAMAAEMETPPVNPAGAFAMPEPPSFVASQVQSGLLTALRDGATRLDLQLHPAELGAITITLVARNGELTAQIRSERSETAEALSRQMDAIRANLEEQGVKVDKIEVTVENQTDNGRGDFENLDQHNSWQEEASRRRELNRLRNLSALRNMDAENSDLAQSVHNIGQAAKSAGHGLDIRA